MPSPRNVIVVGGGIVGLATAYRLLQDQPGLGLTLIEKEDAVGGHQSSHNSGVIHAGIYYAPGSLKAKLCTEGKLAMEAFAREHDIPFVQNGKVVVAVQDDELDRLDELFVRSQKNGVEGLAMLDKKQLQEIEPNVDAIRGIHSPTTGVIDFLQVCEVLAREIRDAGAELLLGTEVTAIDERGDKVVVRTSAGVLTADVLVTCTGVQSDRVAAMSQPEDDEHIVPFRGSWVELTGPSADLVRGNIYPVPDPTLPFLGVHATRRIDGRVWAGPNAMLSMTRENYRHRYAVTGKDLADTLTFPGFWKLAKNYIGHGARELYHDLFITQYVKELQRYVPDVRPDDVIRGPWGLRGQALRRDGSMVDDFSINETARIVHVRNAPSPAATSSLAIGRMIAETTTAKLA